jgi:hypothetical protein
VVDGHGSRVRDPLKGVDPRWADACRAVLEEQLEEPSVTKSLTLRRARARLDRDFGPVLQSGFVI